ncbi:MAG TPA: HAD family acid phosphatase [Xanthobacteraceae bacterium]
MTCDRPRRAGDNAGTLTLRWTAAIFAVALLLPATLGHARAEVPAGCEPPPKPQKLEATRPLNLGQLKLQLLYYRCTRYDAELAGVLQAAHAWVDHSVARFKKPALVLDIDETSLSNWKQIHQNDFGYIVAGACDFSQGSACGQTAWEHSAGAEPIRPTLDLFNAAKAKHVAVFFITGRHESDDERAATETNLHQAGYAGWQHLYMRTNAFGGPSVAPFKTSARQDIESQGYTIIANVGDQHSDLANGHALRTFKLPNPFYYLP